MVHMRWLRSALRWAHYLVKTAWGRVDREHPILVHVIPMRRCNLAFDNWRTPQDQPAFSAGSAEDQAAAG